MGEAGIDASGPTRLDVGAEARTMAGPIGGPQVGAPELERGATLGRYLVIERLGAGGMGVVYAAYDPELDRKVAIKLLRSEVAGDPELARARLVREAQAMAKLSHPNVVAVHEVRTFGEQVFVAMAFVAGGTLAGWIEGTKRGWREVLGMFLETGRGLAAAHAAGVVHRDFKPDNVLIGDGRPQVTDFGLARVVAAPELAQPGPFDPLSSAAIGLTQAGAVMGTPAYMAPEQHLGLVADARSDQFAFCVALWQGLYGQLPFAGETLHELALAVTSGQLATAPRGEVPTWLQRVLVRGLSVDPATRWPTIEALLAALADDPSRARRRRLGWLAGAGLALGLGLAAWRVQARQAAVCVESGAAVATVWNPAAREAVRAALLATGEPYAADAWARVEGRVDAWSEAWRRAQLRACEVRDELSGPRLVCLGDRLRELRSLVGLLSAADSEVAARAVQAAASLPSIAVCDDPIWLAATIKPPEDAAVRARVEAEREHLSQAAAQLRGGHYDAGQALASAALAVAEDLDYAPLRAEALVQVGVAQELQGEYAAAAASLEAAYNLAARTGHDEVAALATIALTRVAGKRLAQHAAGLVWSRVAAVIVARLGEEEGLLGADLRSEVGQVLDARGDSAAAIVQAREALAIREARLGSEHPDVATSLHNLGVASLHRGARDEAADYLERALTIRRAVLGAEHPEVAASYNWLGNTSTARGQNDQAIALHRAALAIREKTLPPDHPDIASSLNNLGGCLSNEGDHEAALALQRRALAICERTLAPEHPDIAASWSNLGSIYAGLGRHAEARTHYQQALRRWERSLGPNHPALAFALLGIGKSYLEEGDAAAALEPLERALALRSAAEVDSSYRVEALHTLARALWAVRPEQRPRARALVEQARGLVADDPKARAELDRWLAEHPLAGP
ncbi:MAG: serine/threonine protein kinase [Nannocystis sp.]|uniref:serine/threonine-protein kinase n=1 Tax=Nannocystis sp. TaxID=1962667 RepID=UPI0024275B9B|nr:serine/threonine-protein kinase [Nannocystis sp.]MBK9754073.1 serine/threonine protein kinase [Nannocystis sp.]